MTRTRSSRPPPLRVLTGLLALLGTASAAQIVPAAPVETEAERNANGLAKTHAVARCLVRDFRPVVTPILSTVPGSGSEASEVAQIRRRGLKCVETVGKVKDGALYIASWNIAAPTLRGVLAEALFEADFSRTARLRPRELARVAPAGEAVPETDTDPAGADSGDVRRFAACAVRNGPEDAAALMASEPGSPAETEGVRRLVRDFDGCFATGDRRSVNVPTVRGLVAEALYRDRSALARGEPLAAAAKVERGLVSSPGQVVIVPAAVAGAGGQAGNYDAQDVRTLVELSRCIARRRPADTQELLSMDHREAGYDRMAKWVASRSMTCVPRGRLRFSRLLFAGGLAEEMLAARPGGGVPPGLSAGASDSAPKDGDVTEAIGSCLVRSRPASVAGFLATVPASVEENRVVQDLAPHIAKCVAPGKTARIGQPSLRAVTALAAYRLVQQQAAAPRPDRN